MYKAIPTDTTVSHYRTLSLLGAGGMGEVYLARDVNLDRIVALKFLPANVVSDQKRMRRFLQEAKAASALSHPNVAQIYEIGEADGVSFIAMEYVEGKTLDAKIDGRPLDIRDIVDIGVQIADALDEAHIRGITHRDIKPGNIMITPRGQVKVLDFGLAKVASPVGQTPSSDMPTQAKTEPGVLMGTVPYMSPEQALGHEVDARSDVFSLGTVLYEMATGRRPFSGANANQTVDQIVHAQPQAIALHDRDVPSGLELVILRCLEKDRERRYQSAKELLVDLRRLQSPSYPSPQRKELRRPYRRRSVLLLGVALLLLLALKAPVQDVVRRLVGLVDVPAQKHLVVLPFANVGDNPTSKAFCDGLVETITSKLSELEQFHGSLLVVPTSEVREREIASVRQAQRTFGVTLVVTGSMQREGDRVRLTLNLVDAMTLRQLRSTVDDYTLANASALQDGIVIKLARMLELELQPQVHRVLSAGHTTVPSAYDFYLQGRGYLQRFEKEKNIDTAIGLFEQALTRDPKYALAHAGLAEAYWRKYEESKETQWVEKAVSHSHRAVEMDDSLPAVHMTLGLILTGTGRYEEAVQQFRRALELDPVSTDAYREMARAYEAMGTRADLDKAEATYLKAIELRPSYWAGYNHLGRFYYSQGRYEDAIKQFSEVVALTPDNFRGYASLGGIYFHLERWEEAKAMYERSLEIEPNSAAFTNLGTLYFYQGRYSEAAKMYEKALQFNNQDYQLWAYLAAACYWAPSERGRALANYKRAAQMAEQDRKVNPQDPKVLADLAGYYGVMGDRKKALPLIEQILTLAPNDVHVIFEAAHTYEQLGERERALKWIGRALQQGLSQVEVERNPWLKQLRADKRYHDLLEQIEKPRR